MFCRKEQFLRCCYRVNSKVSLNNKTPFTRAKFNLNTVASVVVLDQ